MQPIDIMIDFQENVLAGKNLEDKGLKSFMFCGAWRMVQLPPPPPSFSDKISPLAGPNLAGKQPVNS